MPTQPQTHPHGVQLTLTHEERDILHRALTIDLSELSDPHHLDHLSPEAHDTLQLLENLAHSHQPCTLTTPHRTLTSTLQRLADTAQASLEAGYDPDYADEDLDTWATCRRLLAQLPPTTPATPQSSATTSRTPTTTTH
jgi:hypothetical protein